MDNEINQADNFDQTPFYIVCEKGFLDIVKLLLNDQRIDVNKANKSGQTPFYRACLNKQIEVIRILIQEEERINLNGQTPFFIACLNGHIEIVKILLSSDSRVDFNKGDYSSWTPFHLACQNGHIEIVKLLLNDDKIDVNKVNKDGVSSFYLVCQNGIINVAKLLLNDQRVDGNKAKVFGETPFYSACQEGHIEIVKLLLSDKRIDVNKAKIFGETPFWIACQNEHIEIVKLLLNDERVDKTQTQNDYWASFWMACYNGEINNVKLLLTNNEGIDVNQANNDGLTAFHIACYYGHIELVKLLLNDKRISIRRKNNQGKTAMDIANEREHSKIVKLIQEFDTEQMYQEYLETFQITPFIRIENEKIKEQDFLTLSEYLKKNNNIKVLTLTNCDLTSSILLEILKTLIWKYRNLQLAFKTLNIQIVKIDDIKLESTEGLEIIPIEIRNQGTKSIVQYIIDLCKSPNSNPLYRTKLMVVGYENVGKTTLLDCLFPIMNTIEVPNFLGVNYKYYFTLEGKYLKQYFQGKLYKQYILENKEWSLTKKVKKEKNFGIKIEKIQNPKEKIKLYFEDEEMRDKWIERLRRLTLNAATHGIEVNNHIWKSSTLNQHQHQNNNFEAKQEENGKEKKDKDDEVEYSTWDFAGQNDYYNTHHYFLSNRSIFLVLYRMDKGIKGLESLDFWLKSLSSHLNQNYCDGKGKPFYSIIVIGTFLDSIIDNQNDEDKNLRQTKIMKIYDKSGLKSPPFYFEVSCSTLENIDELREIIFNVSLSHSYMGEKIPIGYLLIEKSIYELRKLNQNHPIIEIQELINHVQSQFRSSFEFEFDIDFTKRALKLLHEWGICIYFDEPIELSNVVVLDPQHFTKKILGNLFKADESIRQLRSNGIIDYSQLNKIWNGPTDLIDTYLSLLQKFEVCFILKGQQNGNQKKLIIPNLLSEDKMEITEEKLEKKWPITIPRGEIEIERIFSFNQVPSEMVSRLLVRFHGQIVDNIIWRRGVLLKHFNDNKNENENVLCLLEVKMSENLFEIRIRGKEREKCLEIMKYVYEEVKNVSGNYGGVKWKECVRSPHFSKGLIDLNDIHQDCKLELKDRKLKCPITHFPIYGEDLLFKTGLLDSLDNQNNIGDYWKYSYENQNQESQKSETEPIFENAKISNEKEYEKVEYLLKLFGFDNSKIDKVIGIENKAWKKSFDICRQQIFVKHQNPNLFKREDWIERSEPELRKSFLQYLGDYISKFRKIGWNHGNNEQTEDAAWRISDAGFGTVCKIDDGYYSQGVYVTSKPEYAEQYCKEVPKVFGFVIVGNPFPVIEHPFKAQKNYNGKPINPGYQSHFTLVDGRDKKTAFPIEIHQLKEKWVANELVVHESQTYPSYIVYYK